MQTVPNGNANIDRLSESVTVSATAAPRYAHAMRTVELGCGRDAMPSLCARQEGRSGTTQHELSATDTADVHCQPDAVVTLSCVVRVNDIDKDCDRTVSCCQSDLFTTTHREELLVGAQAVREDADLGSFGDVD
jgi:hypothetical protein